MALRTRRGVHDPPAHLSCRCPEASACNNTRCISKTRLRRLLLHRLMTANKKGDAAQSSMCDPMLGQVLSVMALSTQTIIMHVCSASHADVQVCRMGVCQRIQTVIMCTPARRGKQA